MNIEQLVYNRIKEGRFNFEKVMIKGTYYNVQCSVLPLFCSYGQIGYTIYIGKCCIHADFELGKTEIYYNDKT